MKAILIASIATSLAAATLASIDPVAAVAPLPDWKDAPDEFKKGVEAQVQSYLADPELTPAAVHAAWLAAREAEGWTFGEKTDTEAKQSPNIVPWSQAPVLRRVLETLVHAAAHALKDVPDEAAPQVTVRNTDAVQGRDVAPIVVTPEGHVMVQYVGHRATYKDGTYGTGITWSKGESKPVQAAVAALLLRHPDVYKPGVASTSSVPAPVVATNDKQAEEERLQDVRDSINAMRSKASVRDFVKSNFQQDLGEEIGLADLKAKAIQLVDQFGVAA